MATNPLPPNDEREAWIQRNVAKLRQTLTDPGVRRESSNLLTGEPERYGSSHEDAETP
jgi:hypothetical protein